jgi:hypothetical protein
MKRGVKQEPFVKLPRSLVASKAWRTMSINERRLIDVLILEHMRHAGQRNGQLVAPRKQLEVAGIGARHISAAIARCVTRGLIDRKRGRGRAPNVYALTWLPLHDNSPVSNRWKFYGIETTVLNNDFPSCTSGISEGKSQAPLVASEGKSEGHFSRVSEGKHPYRKVLTRERGMGDAGGRVVALPVAGRR